MIDALEGDEWSAARAGRTLPPGKTRYPLYRRLGEATGPVWTGGKSRLYRDSIPDSPARSQSLYRLSYRPKTRRWENILKGKNPKVVFLFVCFVEPASLYNVVNTSLEDLSTLIEVKVK